MTKFRRINDKTLCLAPALPCVYCARKRAITAVWLEDGRIILACGHPHVASTK